MGISNRSGRKNRGRDQEGRDTKVGAGKLKMGREKDEGRKAC